MQVAARYSAAIEVLDTILQGTSAERALSGWARSHRFAGSKDRAAIRDIVFDVLRHRRSAQVAGGGLSGRQLVLGLLRQFDHDLDLVFGAGGHAPAPLTDEERTAGHAPQGDDVLNLPAGLIDQWKVDLGPDAATAAAAQLTRAPTCLRISTRRTTLSDAIAALARDDIDAAAVSGSSTALHVTRNPQRLRAAHAYVDGLVEIQDVSSQQAVERLALRAGDRILDYCAGGGGKALAIADMHDVSVVAHDVNAARTADIAPRAKRAGLQIEVANTAALSRFDRFDMVFCDAPCSGAGTWRRNPNSKWGLTSEKLQDFNILQAKVIADAAQFLRPGGTLIYATCSVFRSENEAIVDAFAAASGFDVRQSKLRLPDVDGDGFFWAELTANP